uniref:SprT-like domain-containing protein n=1 Tax=Kwoniella dejecticola CBS 10117 TaxID=1296121 RepID=A0A1A6A1I5_9TREE|nr:uncharacterized protein I303_06208 [Kwoniella dejecticola CBS 10117]OBR83922.1 hypothetical protein I303_06208 [Kwoniella dejecticola CBS 10117]
MIKTPYSSRRRIIIDSPDSDEGLEEVNRAYLMRTTTDSVSPPVPGPSVPRKHFPKTPLTPSRRTNFAPTPLKKLDFSSSIVKTPGRKLQGLRLLKSSTEDRRDQSSPPADLFEHCETGGHQDERGAISDGLLMELGGLRLEDEHNADFIGDSKEANIVNDIDDDIDEDEEDVDGILQLTSHSPIIAVDMPTPIEVLSDSDGSVIWNPTPRRTPGKRIVLSDSEPDSEPEAHPPTSPSSPSITRKHVAREPSASPSDQHVRPQGKPKRKPAVLRFIEDQALDLEEDEMYDEEDDTLGSLRDFIVDDEYDSEEEEEEDDEDEDEDGSLCSSEEDDDDSGRGERSGGEESDGIEILSTPPLNIKTKKPNRTESYKDEGILHYSPPKRIHILDLQLPDLDQLVIASSDSDSDSGPVHPMNTGTGRDKSQKKAFTNKGWAEERERIANAIFMDLDHKVFEKKLGAEGVGAKVIWNKRLLTTAGVARSKRVTKNGESTKEHWIELSEKVLTGEKQIINTVAHEMCHLATWIISNEYRNPHGRVFKSWGRKVMRVRKDIEVTTTHAYTIEYKYQWRCSTDYCGKVYKRHSKSIDTTKHACGSCKGKLVPLFETKQKASSAFQLYLKSNMKHAKNAMPGTSHGEVMRALSKRWNESGERGDHEVFWKSAALAARA